MTEGGMALTVEIDHPEFEKDVEFDLAGILIKNKGKVELTEDQERLLVAKRQMPTRQILEGNKFVKVTGSSALSSKELEGIIVESNFGPDPSEVAAGVDPEDAELAIVGEEAAEGGDA
jgi:hypothetical protein